MGGGSNRPNVNHGSHGNGHNGRVKRPQNMLGRQFESSGPEGKFRGNAVQLYERYKTAAREVQASDRILAESYLQFADHYYRLAAEYGAFDNDNGLRRDDAFAVESEPGNEQDVNRADIVQDDGDGAPRDEQPSILTAEAGPSRSERHRFRNSFDDQQRDERRREGNSAGETSHMNGHPDPVTQAPVVLRQPSPEQVEAPVAEASVSKPKTASEAPAPASSQAEAPRRRRGRPRKDEAAADADAAPKLDLDMPEAAPPAEAKAEPAPAPAPRKRGRPRKNPLPDEAAKESA